MFTSTSDQWDDLVHGSSAVIAAATVVLGGEVILDDLPIDGGEVTKSSDGRQITQTLRVKVSDTTGALQAGPGAPMMALGQQIVLRAGLADKGMNPTVVELLPMGTFGIDEPEPENESPWKLYPNGKWVAAGGSINVQASDPTAQIAREDFDRAEQPAFNATVRSETERLLQDRLPVATTWGDGVNDAAPVSRQITYDSSRLSVLLNLASIAKGVPWINRDGAYQVLQQVRATSGTWRCAVEDPDNPGRGAVVTFKPSTGRETLYNAVIITSEDSFGNAMRGVKIEEEGPLRWGGPFGRVPLIEENRLATSNAMCQAFAEERYRQVIEGRSITVNVQSLPNFAVDPLDTIELGLPNRTIMGLVTSITYPLSPGLMSMQVSIPFVDWVVS